MGHSFPTDSLSIFAVSCGRTQRGYSNTNNLSTVRSKVQAITDVMYIVVWTMLQIYLFVMRLLMSLLHLLAPEEHPLSIMVHGCFHSVLALCLQYCKQ